MPDSRSRAPKKAPEGLLLFALVVALIITVASMFASRHPAVSAFNSLQDTETEHSSN